MAKFLACTMSVFVLAGCVSSQVQRGALIGAASGLVAGGTVGVLISDKHLLGSDPSRERGNIALPRGGTIGASLLIGTVFGAIVGAMVGHQRDDGYEQPAAAPPAATAPAEGSADTDMHGDANRKEQARAAYLPAL